MSGSTLKSTHPSFVHLLSAAQRRGLLVAAPLVAAHVALLAVFDLGQRPAATLFVLALAFSAWAFAVVRLRRLRSKTAVLAVAALLRLLLVPLPPSLSDDTLRYVWDGRVVAAGFNPYLLPPEAPELAGLRDEAWRRMPHKEVPTVYPPLALAVFTVASQLPFPLFAVKILLVVAELVGCWVLLSLAARLGFAPGHAIAYCWNPLVTLEVAGMGHVDALLAAAVVATVAWITIRPAAAGTAAAAGVLTKLVPVVALPMWARQSRRPFAFLGAAVLVMSLALAPVVIAIGGVPPGLVTYGVSWEFNGPLYEPLWRGLESLELDLWLKSRLDELKIRTERHEFWNRFYPYVYPQLLAKLALAALFGGFLVRSLFDRHPVLGSGRLFGALLLCSATLYPWYLLWVLPWASLARHRAWLAASVLAPLSYLPQLTDVALFPWLYLVIWGPFFILLAGSRWKLA